MSRDARSVQITVRVPESWVIDLDAAAAKLSSAGLTICRTDAARAAMARGLVEILGKGQARPER